jgi:hypothetical protein
MVVAGQIYFYALVVYYHLSLLTSSDFCPPSKMKESIFEVESPMRQITLFQVTGLVPEIQPVTSQLTNPLGPLLTV